VLTAPLRLKLWRGRPARRIGQALLGCARSGRCLRHKGDHTREVILQDVAGMFDELEDVVGIEAAKAALSAFERADLACFVIDASAPFAPDDLQAALSRKGPTIFLLNKADLCKRDSLRELVRRIGEESGQGRPPRHVAVCSAKTGKGLEELKGRISEHVHGAETPAGSEVALNARHRTALMEAAGALQMAVKLARRSQPPAHELVAAELREALDQLGEIVGKTVTEDILGRIFANFCIGK